MTESPQGTIDWLDYGDAAFQRARDEEKLILLDSGATWCHWCHVMDRVTYEDPEVVRMVNERFIPVRIDRDRRPELDARLQREQALVTPMGAAGGWPLTVMLSPGGEMIFKATFLPPRAGGEFGTSAGLVDMLDRVDTYWREHRREVSTAAAQLRSQMQAHLEEAYARPGELADAQIDAVADGLHHAYDPKHGGFSQAPKFFTVGGLELLTARAWAGEADAAEMLERTLGHMDRGGVYDQVAGGWHRYSVDERWHVPHFEKMAADNAALLAIYAEAAALLGRDAFAANARRTLDWIDAWLLSPDGAGFYASQDADVGLDDDGDYFTWTRHEFREALGDDAIFDAMREHYGVEEMGDMRDRPGRNVLQVARPAPQLADLYERDRMEIERLIENGRRKLRQARQKRPAPQVDKTIFADLNGMLIDAYLTVGERLADDAPRRTALRVLDKLLETLRDGRGVFAHYAENGELRVVGLLTDQAWMLRALVHAYANTCERRYFEAAGRVVGYLLTDLVAEDGAFLSAPRPSPEDATAPRPGRSWEDSPSRSAASVAAEALLQLSYLSSRSEYAAAARRALESFAGAVRADWATFLGGWATAVEAALHGPRSVVIVAAADDETGAAMAEIARRQCVPGAIRLELDPARTEHAAQLDLLGYPGDEVPAAYVCAGGRCLEPARTPEELVGRLAELCD